VTKFMTINATNQGPYSQYFIFFVTYEWAQYARVFVIVSLYSLVYSNVLAYWTHTYVMKKITCCE